MTKPIEPDCLCEILPNNLSVLQPFIGGTCIAVQSLPADETVMLAAEHLAAKQCPCVLTLINAYGAGGWWVCDIENFEHRAVSIHESMLRRIDDDDLTKAIDDAVWCEATA